MDHSSNRLVADFAPTDRARRREFDRRLAVFVRRFPDHWHIDALVDLLDVIAGHVGQAQVRLRRRRSGDLDVTVRLTLPRLPTADTPLSLTNANGERRPSRPRLLNERS